MIQMELPVVKSNCYKNEIVNKVLKIKVLQEIFFSCWQIYKFRNLSKDEKINSTKWINYSFDIT